MLLEESGRGKEVGRCREREWFGWGVPGRGGNRGFIRGTWSNTGMTTMVVYDDALVQLAFIILLDPVHFARLHCLITVLERQCAMDNSCGGS